MRRFENIVPGVALLKVPFNDGSYDTGVILVQCNSHNVLIDSGEYAETVDDCILPALKAAGVDELDWLLCTHNHGDHTGGHKRLSEVYSCPVAVFKSDVNGFPTPIDCVLNDGDEIIHGLQLITTPGHTCGSVSYLHAESRTLITGDSFQGCATDGVGLALLKDLSAYRESIRRVMTLGARWLVAGHGFAPCDFVIKGTLYIRAFLQSCLDTVARYEQFVAQHAELDDYVLAAMLVESEGRTLDKYIVRGDSTISACRKSQL
jgi:hydroxyacylglutathione hydrolase